LLGREEPEQVRLGHADPAGDGLGAGAVQATAGELGDRRLEHRLAPLPGAHPNPHVVKVVATHLLFKSDFTFAAYTPKTAEGGEGDRDPQSRLARCRAVGLEPALAPADAADRPRGQI